MSISVSNWVWRHSNSRHGARLVLLALADHGEMSWPSIAAICDKANLGERAVHTAIADLVKLGELEVLHNAGPHGCNRYRIIMDTPAISAPLQNLHPAKVAPPQNLQGPESSQVNSKTPAESAPPADIAGVQILQSGGADSAPGTVREPEEMSSTKTSKGGAGGKRPKSDPDFDAWYAAYPVHKGRGDAEKAWTQARRDGADPDTLIAAAKSYSQEPQVLRGYAKYPATWLRAKCWLDEAAPPPVSRAAAQAAAVRARLAAKENHEQA